MANGRGFYTAAQIRRRLSISTLVFHGFRPLSEGALASGPQEAASGGPAPDAPVSSPR
ncbi:MAG: hypothetical protein AB1505_13985 [Candidatus Latescibacterota bacterium]